MATTIVSQIRIPDSRRGELFSQTIPTVGLVVTSVDWNTVGGTATPYVDYIPVETVQHSTTISVQTLNDHVLDIDTFKIVGTIHGYVSTIYGNVYADQPFEWDITIGSASTISFSTSSNSVTEGGIVTYNLVRSNIPQSGDTGASVQVTTRNGTAIAGEDYDVFDEIVNFAAGQTTATFQVQTLVNPEGPLNPYFEVDLTDPITNAVLGSIPAEDTTIVYNSSDPTPPAANSTAGQQITAAAEQAMADADGKSLTWRNDAATAAEVVDQLDDAIEQLEPGDEGAAGEYVGEGLHILELIAHVGEHFLGWPEVPELLVEGAEAVFVAASSPAVVGTGAVGLLLAAPLATAGKYFASETYAIFEHEQEVAALTGDPNATAFDIAVISAINMASAIKQEAQDIQASEITDQMSRFYEQLASTPSNIASVFTLARGQAVAERNANVLDQWRTHIAGEHPPLQSVTYSTHDGVFSGADADGQVHVVSDTTTLVFAPAGPNSPISPPAASAPAPPASTSTINPSGADVILLATDNETVVLAFNLSDHLTIEGMGANDKVVFQGDYASYNVMLLNNNAIFTDNGTLSSLVRGVSEIDFNDRVVHFDAAGEAIVSAVGGVPVGHTYSIVPGQSVVGGFDQQPFYDPLLGDKLHFVGAAAGATAANFIAAPDIASTYSDAVDLAGTLLQHYTYVAVAYDQGTPDTTGALQAGQNFFLVFANMSSGPTASVRLVGLNNIDQLSFADIVDQAPVASVAGVTSVHGQSLAASSLFAVGDAENDPITKYQFYDSTADAASGHWTVNGVAQGAGQYIDVTAAQLAQTSFQSGSGSDDLWVRASDGTAWGAWKEFHVTAPIDQAPVTTAVDRSVAHAANPASSSLFSVSDAENDTVAKYQFYDSTADAASGHWTINGVAQGAGQYIDVTAAQLAQTSFQSGSGSDDLWVRTNDGIAWGAWKEFHVTAPGDQAPVVTAADRNVGHAANPAASSLFSVSDAESDAIAKYQFYDSTADAASGHWTVNGVAQGTGQYIDVTAAQLAQTSFQSGSGSDDLWVRANDGIAWGAWKEFHVTAPTDQAPIVTAADRNVAHGANPAASSLFSVSDAENDAMARYQFYDSTADAASGHWVVNGVAQGAGQYIDVTATQLAQTSFQSGSGSDDLWVRANDGIAWGAWKEFHVTAPADQAPVVTAPDRNVAHGANPAASSLFSVGDAEGDGIAKYQFYDSTADAASGHWVVNGVAQAANQYIDVTAAQLAQTSFQSGSGSDDLWVRANDGMTWSAWKEFHVTAPLDRAPVVATSNVSLSKFLSLISASSLFTASDADGDAITKYGFWNTGAGGGVFLLNGVTQAVGQEIVVSAAQLSQLSYQAGSSAETLWERANDGYSWGAWSTAFTVSPWVNTAPTVTASNLTVPLAQSIAASTLFAAVALDGDAITNYAFWDTGAGGGHFVLNGVAQGTNREIDVPAVQLAQLTYTSGSGADTLWVKAFDGTQWGPWSSSFMVTGVNMAPQLSSVAANASYAQRGAATTLSPGLVVSDANNVALVGATVSITGGTFTGDGDVLAATTTGTSITANWNSATETLTLSGGDTLAAYQNVLDSVTFASTSPNPAASGSHPTRTVTWVVNDGMTSNNLSVAKTTTVSIIVPNYSYTAFDDPFATSGTVASAINSAGKIVGTYQDGTGFHGFVDDGGTFTTLNAPSAVNGTFVQGINQAGQIVGYYKDSSSIAHGFAYSAGTYYSVPDFSAYGTFAEGINDSPGAVGYYRDGSNIAHGFFTVSGLFSGTFSAGGINVPLGTKGTFPMGTNNSGQIVGYYLDSNNKSHGFLSSQGTYTTLDDPLATGGTQANGINASGDIVGYYTDSTGQHGFIYSGGSWTTINEPSGIAGGATQVTGINDAGQIVGSYVDGSGQHAFVATPTLLTPNITVASGAVFDLTSPYAGTVTFAGSTGTLRIATSSSFTGTISGQLATTDRIDLADITAGPLATLAYSGNNSPGTLTVSDGIHTAHLNFSGNYSLASFIASSDGHGGTIVVDPPPASQIAAVPDLEGSDFMASVFASANAGGAGNQSIDPLAAQLSQPFIAGSTAAVDLQPPTVTSHS